MGLGTTSGDSNVKENCGGEGGGEMDPGTYVRGGIEGLNEYHEDFGSLVTPAA